MLRKLLIPLAATTLLAGCVTAPYEYRGHGDGGYYYGAPSVEYRYRYADPGYYGAPYYGPYRPGLSVWGSYGYPYYYGPYGYPRYGYPVYRHPRPRPDSNATPRPEGGPWRNPDEIRRRRGIDGAPPPPGPQPSAIAPPPRPAAARGGEGSRMGELIRRARKPGTRED